MAKNHMKISKVLEMDVENSRNFEFLDKNFHIFQKLYSKIQREPFFAPQFNQNLQILSSKCAFFNNEILGRCWTRAWNIIRKCFLADNDLSIRSPSIVLQKYVQVETPSSKMASICSKR